MERGWMDAIEAVSDASGEDEFVLTIPILQEIWGQKPPNDSVLAAATAASFLAAGVRAWVVPSSKTATYRPCTRSDNSDCSHSNHLLRLLRRL